MTVALIGCHLAQQAKPCTSVSTIMISAGLCSQLYDALTTLQVLAFSGILAGAISGRTCSLGKIHGVVVSGRCSDERVGHHLAIKQRRMSRNGPGF